MEDIYRNGTEMSKILRNFSFLYCIFTLCVIGSCRCSLCETEPCPYETKEDSKTEDADLLTWTVAPDEAFIGILSNSSAYNKNLAPGQLLKQTTTVNVAVYIESISSFKAQTMDFEVDMYLAMSWYDHRLAHSFAEPILVIAPETAAQMWHPDLYFVNSKSASFQIVTTPNFMVLVYSDGFVFKSLRIDVTLSCMMQLYNFPMDEHKCPIWIQSYAYVINVVNLTWFVDAKNNFPINSNSEIKLNDMFITGQSFEACSYLYPMFRGKGYWSCLVGYIQMKRMVTFHILQTYFPTTMLVCISWLSFWLDMRAAPARVGLIITTLLTLVSVGNGARQDLPQVSYIKAIDIWLTVCTAFVFCVLLEYTLVSHHLGRKQVASSCRHNRKKPQAWEVNNSVLDGTNGTNVYETRCSNQSTPFKPQETDTSGRLDGSRGLCTGCAVRAEKAARRIDRFSQVLFPATFTAFGIVYFTYYSLKYYN